MQKVYRHLGTLLAAALIMGLSSQAEAASKQKTVDACAAAIKKEFGESPIEFDKFRRNDSRNFAFGTLTMSDGNTAQVRCQMRGGKIIGVQFRGSDEPGKSWVNQRPPAAIFVEKKTDEKAADETEDGVTKTAAPAGGGAGGDAKKDEAGKKADAGKNDAAGKKADNEKEDADKTANAEKADKDTKTAENRPVVRRVGEKRDSEKKAETKDEEKVDTSAEKAEDAEAEEKKLVKPRFMKAPKG